MLLSVLIAAREEEYLEKTIENVLERAQGETEVIVVLDGAWPKEPLPDNPKVTLIHHAVSIGQRAAINEAARVARGKYIMKLDAHCAVDEGFDVKLAEDCEYDWTVVPRMFTLFVRLNHCNACDVEFATSHAKCPKCESTDLTEVPAW